MGLDQSDEGDAPSGELETLGSAFHDKTAEDDPGRRDHTEWGTTDGLEQLVIDRAKPSGWVLQWGGGLFAMNLSRRGRSHGSRNVEASRL